MKKFNRILSGVLAGIMAASTFVTGFAATTDPSISAREIANSEFSKYAATQGMVLLENQGGLPIAKSGKVALFGAGATRTIAGGTGSGAVNQRSTTTVRQGFENAGYELTSTDYLAKIGTGSGVGSETDVTPYLDAAKGADVAVYVLNRNSGEGSDRTNAKGNYLLSDVERANIEKISAAFETTIVVINSGGVIDTKFYNEVEGLDAMLLMSQAGMRGGDAVVEVLNGTVNPSGKLTDTWPVNYSDYANAATFGNNDKDTKHEIYNDDIYVGYRYFDTFGVDVAYEFGFGLSYTDFDINIDAVNADADTVTVKATVTNTGDVSGKEVVEVYFSAPDGELEKPYQELAAFGKTDELAPGASQTLTLSFNLADMSSYSMDKAAYILEAGDYVIRVGNSSRNTHVGAVVTVDNTVVTEQLSNQMVQDEEMPNLLSNKDATPITYAGEAEEIAAANKIAISSSNVKTENNASALDEELIKSYVFEGSTYTKATKSRTTKGTSGNSTVQARTVFDPADGTEEIVVLEKTMENPTLRDVATNKISMTEFVAGLTVTQMSDIVEGLGWGGGASSDTAIGAQANSVKGAAGETTSKYYASHLIPNITLPDGPAGVRITQSYKDGNTTYYQYATAFPIGTLIAQTWDKDIIKGYGDAVGTELEEFHCTLWLAPGMNIHRNALCGRNFEYYSEDPLIAGLTAAYATLGVQSHSGIGVTIKHYAVNNQEAARNSENNTVTERALREIYLKGFEIAVKMAQPMAIMTSYNQNNSMPAADDYDLCTDIPRGEWGFQGLIMTDWGGGQSQPVNSMHAGNDLIMPGGSNTTIANAVNNGSLPLGDLQKSAANVLNVIMQTSQFEKITREYEGEVVTVGSYSANKDLQSFVTVEKSDVEIPLVITEQPVDHVGAIDSVATFAVETNLSDVSYQWFYSNNNGANWIKSGMPGATTDTLNVEMKAFRVGQQYKVVVTDSNGNTVSSNAVSLAKASATVAIVENPANQTGAVGETVTFSVKAEGEVLTYQWMYSNNGGMSWIKSSFAGNATDTLSAECKAFRNGQMYKCVVTDANGVVVESAPATMTVQ